MTESGFLVPPQYGPSEWYFTKTERVSQEGSWTQLRVQVMRWRGVDQDPGKADQAEQVGEYERNYSLLDTFCPFRQYRDGVWRDYALIAPEYTRTSVMDLSTGEVIAREAWPIAEDDLAFDGRELWKKGEEIPGRGFCPAQFYVPDWWDDNDGSILPGSKYWSPEDERITGEVGFVAGCYWGDDSTWKIRHLDLSRITDGVLTGDDRFGYIELTRGQRLADAVTYDPGDTPAEDRVEIAVRTTFGGDGRVLWKWWEEGT